MVKMSEIVSKARESVLRFGMNWDPDPGLASGPLINKLFKTICIDFPFHSDLLSKKDETFQFCSRQDSRL